MIDYKFNEDQLLAEVEKYIDNTYSEHYSGKIQALEVIIDSGHGIGFCLGSIQKYAKRYGKKAGFNRLDLLKIVHYAIIALHSHDLNNDKEEE